MNGNEYQVGHRSVYQVGSKFFQSASNPWEDPKEISRKQYFETMEGIRNRAMKPTKKGVVALLPQRHRATENGAKPLIDECHL